MGNSYLSVLFCYQDISIRARQCMLKICLGAAVFVWSITYNMTNGFQLKCTTPFNAKMPLDGGSRDIQVNIGHSELSI